MVSLSLVSPPLLRGSLTPPPPNRRGKLVKDRKTGKERLDCRNWECGVVIPANQRKPAVSAQIHTSEPTDTTPGTDEVVNVDDAQTKWTAAFADIALPLRFPGRRYAETGPGSHPWFFHD